jgi:hypothetical protein
VTNKTEPKPVRQNCRMNMTESCASTEGAVFLHKRMVKRVKEVCMEEMKFNLQDDQSIAGQLEMTNLEKNFPFNSLLSFSCTS